MFKLILAALVVLLAAPQTADAQSRPSRSCKQTQEQCVKDRMATGSSARRANERCAEILSKCKK